MKKLLALLALSATLLLGQNPNTPAFPTAAATDNDLFVANNGSGGTTLNGSITNVATSIVLTSGTGFTAPVIIKIESEIIHCTTLTSNTLSVCTRGLEGTSAASHSSAVAVYALNTAWHHNQVAAEIKAVETGLAANNLGYAAGGGSANAQTVTLVPAVGSLTNGLKVCWKPIAANSTTTPTLAVNGLTAKTIVKVGGAALVSNDLTTTAVACAIYDGTNFELQNPQTVNSGCSTSNVPNGGLVCLETHTASSSAELDFTGCISSSYDDYVIRIINLIPATSAQDLKLQVSIDGGSTYDSTSGHYTNANWTWVSGGASAIGSATSTYITVATGQINTTANYNTSGEISFTNPSGANFKNFYGHLAELDTRNSGFQGLLFSSAYIQTTAINAFRFIMTSGAITSGIIRCYGVSH